jgi:PIN domain nuclease of toxin-antitoxin system
MRFLLDTNTWLWVTLRSERPWAARAVLALL